MNYNYLKLYSFFYGIINLSLNKWHDNCILQLMSESLYDLLPLSQ